MKIFKILAKNWRLKKIEKKLQWKWSKKIFIRAHRTTCPMDTSVWLIKTVFYQMNIHQRQGNTDWSTDRTVQVCLESRFDPKIWNHDPDRKFFWVPDRFLDRFFGTLGPMTEFPGPFWPVYPWKGKFKRRVLMDCLMKLRVEKNDAPGNREFQERAISALLRRLRNNFTFFFEGPSDIFSLFRDWIENGRSQFEPKLKGRRS